MSVQKAFGSWLYPSVVILPAWLLIGYGFFGSSSGWTFVGLVIAAPILLVALAVVASLVAFRPSVRVDRRPNWTDVGLVGGWHLSIIGFGFYPTGGWIVGLLSIVLGLAAFWSRLSAFLAEARAAVAFVSATGGGMPGMAGAAGPGVGFGGPSYGAAPNIRLEPQDLGEVPSEPVRPRKVDGFDPDKPQDGQTIRLD